MISPVLVHDGATLEMLADIETEIDTEFATYKPCPVVIVPAAATYTIAADFSNVVNFAEFTFSEAERQLLLQNGFVVTSSTYLEMYDIYSVAREANIPIFVTVDSLLHTYHEVYDYALRTVESRKLMADLAAINEALTSASLAQYAAATEWSVRTAAHRNVAYFAVAAKLLDPSFVIPSDVVNTVTAELALIDAHAGLGASPIFGYLEDYSQYVPRGHYTLSEELQRYFRAMMWYGRMTFHCEAAPLLGVSQQMAEEATRRALLLVQLMDRVSVTTEPAMSVWERIYIPTTFFVGKTDDLAMVDYFPIARSVYGNDLASVAVDDFADNAKLSQVLAALAALPDPRIAPDCGKGLRFMGQRFIPDSYMFTELVFPETARNFPRGLDVMAVLGSQRAYEILDQVYHETDDLTYVTQMAALQAEFTAMADAVWCQNLYWNWLYCLMPLLVPKGHGFPTYMQNPAWTDKELSGALGSWAELRHDTILYAKQSYTLGMVPCGYRDAFVEPNPWAFGRMASLARLTIDGLGNLGLLLDDYRDELADLELLLLSLKEMAEKELTSQPLTVGETRLIRTIGRRLARLTVFEDPGDLIAEDDMAVIADVHTDFLVTNCCLEVGVGRPLTLYVIVGSGDELVVAVGSAFSYYEFTWPVGDRLTDEAWREMLSGASPPDLPEWMGSFIDLTAPLIVPEPDNVHNPFDDFWGQMTMTVQAAPSPPSGRLLVHITLDGCSAERLCIEALCGSLRQVVELTPCGGGGPHYQEFEGILNTLGWPSGTVCVTVYDPDDLTLFITDSFSHSAVAAVPSRIWPLY